MLEVHVRKHLLSPVASLAMSLSLMLGILVADLVNVHSVTAAGAQAGRARGTAVVANGRVISHNIRATNVLVNGVATNGVFRGSVAIVDSLLSGVDPTNITGAYPWDFTGSPSSNGAYPWDDSEAPSGNGAYPWDDSEAPSGSGAYPWDSPTDTGGSSGVQLTGGVVEGENVRVIDGVITGENLTVVGTVVSR